MKLKERLEVSVGRTGKPTSNVLPELTPKDEKDIQKDLEKLIQGLDPKTGYSLFDGQNLKDINEEDLELENAMRIRKL